jgi:predicted PurR-regulated permease PerM
MAFVVVVAIAVVSLVVMAIVAIAVSRELRTLGRSMARFQEETQPLLEELQRQSAKAQERGAAIQEAGDRLRGRNS